MAKKDSPAPRRSAALARNVAGGRAPAATGKRGRRAEYVGTSLADLMNRKDVLVRQLASVEQQIADAGKRATTRASQAVSAAARRLKPASGASNAGATGTGASKGGTPADPEAPEPGRKGNRKKKRALPPDDPMVAATTRATMADAKARTALQIRTSRRAGNR
jgi:hypothetical protein